MTGGPREYPTVLVAKIVVAWAAILYRLDADPEVSWPENLVFLDAFGTKVRGGWYLAQVPRRFLGHIYREDRLVTGISEKCHDGTSSHLLTCIMSIRSSN